MTDEALIQLRDVRRRFMLGETAIDEIGRAHV